MDNTLKCRDIKGNVPGFLRLGNFHSKDRKDVREIGRNDDIVGSGPSTRVVGIKVPSGMKARQINPL